MRSVRLWSALAAIFALTTTLLVAPPGGAPRAAAATAADFDPGNLISDENFFDGDAMNADAVQSFLDAQLRSCTAGYTCLKGYSQATPAMGGTARCSALPAMGSASAATIIARVGAACGISQKVLLVLLQKEQSLVTDPDPTQRQFDRATGFACPDTAPCDSSFGGFFYQVYYAARQFKVYSAYPANYNHIAGRWNQVLYHPNAACGSSPVFIANQATAGLYNYTPYQPNAAALRNLYSTGDDCSAYGNRNFWRMWSDWFGNPAGPSGPPFGSLEAVKVDRDIAEVSGWAIDPDVREPIDIHVYVSGPQGRVGTAGVANLTRTDVGNAHPSYGPQHGFSIDVSIPAGQSEVCVAAINRGAGQDTWLGCRTVTGVAGTGQSGPPFGSFEGARVDADLVEVSGWAIDPDVLGPVDVHVYVSNTSGRVGTPTVADKPRPDVARVHPAFGPNHGFSVEVRVPAGQSEICVVAINQRVGQNVWLGCRTVVGEPGTGRTGPPFGSFEGARVTGDIARVSGWAIDPDVTRPIEIHVYASGSNGRVGTSTMANLERADVARAYPVFGAQHGFSVDVRISPGAGEICVAAINQRAGQNTWLGCKPVTGPVVTGQSGPPFGNLEAVKATPTGAEVSGWVIDPDTAAPTDVHVYVNGRGVPPVRADGARADVARIYPVFGANHGFSTTLSLAAGAHEVCVFGINIAGPGGNVLLGCRTVTVAAPAPPPALSPQPGVNPFGNFEAATVSGASASVSGWALDPDAGQGPIDVHVYVTSSTGRVGTATVANLPRADVGRAYPSYGSAHGFGVTVPIGAGSNEICVAAINKGGGSNVWLGCRTVRR